MSIASQITALQSDKTAIASAITAKGGTVTGGGFDTFATDISNIPSSGGGMNYVEVSTASTTLTPSWDTLYQWTVNPTSITISAPTAPANSTKEIVLKFTTGATAPTMSFPSAFLWKDGESVEFLASTSYEISISYDMLAAACTVIAGGY